VNGPPGARPLSRYTLALLIPVFLQIYQGRSSSIADHGALFAFRKILCVEDKNVYSF